MNGCPRRWSSWGHSSSGRGSLPRCAFRAFSCRDRGRQDVLRSLGATKREIFTKSGIPRSLPYFFASLKVAVTLAFVGAVISETVAANRGIGYLMIAARSRFDVPLVFGRR